MINLNLTIAALFILGCFLPKDEYQKEIDFPIEETIDIFNLDSIVNLIDHSYHEIGFLPSEAKESEYCTWLKNYKNLVNSKIVTSPNYDNREFKIVAYAKFSKDEYVVEYNGSCELANEEEIPGRVIKQIKRISGCPIPKENKFEPKSYSNSISKTYPDSEGALSLIQVWFNK